jgi:hypothetical protein
MNQPLPPDVAFRESLFDALADDEGAAYWEGVYGQPIHIYPSSKAGPEGELEQMSEEEYATYVRGKMWEKSHEHVIEEKRRRDAERKRPKEEEKSKESMGMGGGREKGAWERAVEESLGRGRERKEGKKWRERWDGYVAGWEVVGRAGKIPWPTRSGKEGARDEVEGWLREVARARGIVLAELLKGERVRWHPDKVQQRLGPVEEGEEGERERVMQSVTAVFQVVDRMWNVEREREKGNNT